MIIDDEPCGFRQRRYRLRARNYPQWQRCKAPPDGESGSPATLAVYQGPEDRFRFGHHRQVTGWRGNRMQVLYDVLIPRLQTRSQEFLATELPQVVHICLDRSVQRLVEKHANTALRALLDEKIALLVRDVG